jgi:drug/metabolite transporter (DMT)-like permease
MAQLNRIPGVVLIAVAAALWGTDALFRKPLTGSISATTIVFGEHVLLVALTLPLLLPSLRALVAAGWRYVLAGIFVGAGASALATILFTQAIGAGGVLTPVLLQKVQPLIAVTGAAVILGERPRPRFAWFLFPALAGVWLVTEEHPFAPHAQGLKPIIEALAAAALWGLGTVFGRYLGRKLEFQQVTTVRFAFGLVASAAALPIVGAKAWPGTHNSVWIGYLALVTGLLALSLYYYGLKRTPATLASLAELAYPATAALVGIYAFNAHLRWTQWLGVGVIVATVSLLPLQPRRKIVELPQVDTRLEPAPA